MASIKQKNKVTIEVLSKLRQENPLIDLVLTLADREDLEIRYSEENKLEVIEKWRVQP